MLVRITLLPLFELNVKLLPLDIAIDALKYDDKLLYVIIPLYPIGYKAIAENKLIPIEIRWFLQNH